MDGSIRPLNTNYYLFLQNNTHIIIFVKQKKDTQFTMFI